MADAVEQWRDYFASGRSFAVQPDRGVTETKLRANRTGIVVASSLVALVLVGLVVLLVTDFGRLATYLLVAVLAVAVLVVVVRLWILRKRLRAYAAAGDPLVVVSAESITLSGLPPVPWTDVLGVVATDLVDEYARAGGFNGWLRRTAVRTGGSTVGVYIGVRRAAHIRAGSNGGLVHDLIVVTDDNGAIAAYLDHALPVEQARQVVTAIKVAAWLHGIGFVASSQAKDGIDASSKMLKGERLEPQS